MPGYHVPLSPVKAKRGQAHRGPAMGLIAYTPDTRVHREVQPRDTPQTARYRLAADRLARWRALQGASSHGIGMTSHRRSSSPFALGVATEGPRQVIARGILPGVSRHGRRRMPSSRELSTCVRTDVPVCILGDPREAGGVPRRN